MLLFNLDVRETELAIEGAQLLVVELAIGVQLAENVNLALVAQLHQLGHQPRANALPFAFRLDPREPEPVARFEDELFLYAKDPIKFGY